MPTFYEDVIKNDARFNSVNRVADPGLVEPVTRAAIASILNDARALGIELMIFETYRSQARQQEPSIREPQNYVWWESITMAWPVIW